MLLYYNIWQSFNTYSQIIPTSQPSCGNWLIGRDLGATGLGIAWGNVTILMAAAITED
jgi:hypothetical protein